MGKAINYGKFQVIQSLLSALMSIVFIFVLDMNWQGRVIGHSLAVALFGIASLWSLYKDGFIYIFVSGWRKHSKDALYFGVPLVPHVIGGLLVVASSRLVILNELGIASAGMYMVAFQIAQIIGILTESFNKAYAPWLMKNLNNPSHELKVRIVKGTYLYFLFITIIAIVFGWFAPFFLNYFVGDKFMAIFDLLLYITLGFSLGGCYYMVTNYIFFANKTSWLAVITFSSGVLNIVFMFTFIKQNGLIGAAQSFMLSQLVIFVATWWIAQKLYPMPWLLPFRDSIFFLRNYFR